MSAVDEKSVKAASDFEDMSGSENRPVVPTEKMIENFSFLSIPRERSNILLLAGKLHDFPRLLELLKSSRRYIPRSDRNVMVRAILFYERREQRDLYELICALRASTDNCISRDHREAVAQVLEDLVLKYSPALGSVVPENDDELFGTLIEDNDMKDGVWHDLVGMGAVLCHVLPYSKKMELLGMKPSEEFFSLLTARWKFKNPTKYFDYTGGAMMPIGQLD